MYTCTYAFYCVRFSFQKLELENKYKDNEIHQKDHEIHQKDHEIHQKDHEILELQKNVERLGNQAIYLNKKVNVVQNYLQQTKVCGYI